MEFPPNHHSIYTPVNVVYRIPMKTVYGDGITMPPMPPDSPETLDIDCERIRGIIVELI